MRYYHVDDEKETPRRGGMSIGEFRAREPIISRKRVEQTPQESVRPRRKRGERLYDFVTVTLSIAIGIGAATYTAMECMRTETPGDGAGFAILFMWVVFTFGPATFFDDIVRPRLFGERG